MFGQDSMMEFAQWIDDFAPADPATQPQMFVVTTSLSYLLWFHVVPTKKPGWTLRQNYATSMDVPVLVRPWMLSYRKDFGVSSMIEPDVGSTLLSLFLTEGLVPEFVASISRQNSIQLKMDAWPEPGIRFMSNPDLVGTERSWTLQKFRKRILKWNTMNYQQQLAEVASLLSCPAVVQQFSFMFLFSRSPSQ